MTSVATYSSSLNSLLGASVKCINLKWARAKGVAAPCARDYALEPAGETIAAAYSANSARSMVSAIFW